MATGADHGIVVSEPKINPGGGSAMRTSVHTMIVLALLAILAAAAVSVRAARIAHSPVYEPKQVQQSSDPAELPPNYGFQ